jgi:peroxiredoxin
MTRHYYLGAVLALLTCPLALSQNSTPANPSGEVRPTAPAFNVTSLNGKKFDLAALRGKVIVLNFWFTGCQPCVEEIPGLNDLVDKFKNKDVVFIAPTWDDVSPLQAFLKEHPFKYHIIPNAGYLILGPYNDGTENVAFPTHVVIDREGKIDTRVRGAKHLDDLRKVITRLLNNPSQKAK